MSRKKSEKQDGKAAKGPKNREPKEPQVVFAFRLSEADRTLIHKAAGRGKATRFVLGAALAAATGNAKAFADLTAQAKTHRK